MIDSYKPLFGYLYGMPPAAVDALSYADWVRHRDFADAYLKAQEPKGR